MATRKIIPALLITAFLLTGCSTINKWFTSDDEKPLPGTRISALQLQNDLAPSAALQQTPIKLPDVWDNQLWPQSGGYPTHAMGNLALGAKVKRVWKSSVGKTDKRDPLTATPVVAENTVFTLDSRGNVSAFNIENGKKKWDTSVVPKDENESAAVGGGLSYAEGKLFVTAGYKSLSALDPVSGKKIWNVAIPAPARAAPTVQDGRIYITTIDNRLMVYGVNDGAEMWKYTGISETTNLLGAAGAAADPTITVLPLSSGEISGLSPADGRVLWQDNLSAVRRSGSLSSISDIRGLPVIDSGTVYAISYSGRLVALNQQTGDRLWQREIGSGETPWVAGDAVFVLTPEQQLVALSRASGDIYWVTQLPSKNDDDNIVWAGPVLAGGRLVLTGSNGHMAEVNPVSGKLISDAELGTGSDIAPIVSNNTLLVLDRGGDLSAYR